MKKHILAISILIILLILSYMHNTLISISADRFIEKGEYQNARFMMQNTVSYVPTLYMTSSYFDKVSLINALMSIREFEYFHPPKEDGVIDVAYLEQVAGEVPFSKTRAYLDLYFLYIKAVDAADEALAQKRYTEMNALMNVEQPHSSNIMERSGIFHSDYRERISDEFGMLENIHLYAESYEATGRIEDLYRILTLMRRFDSRMEMRYPPEVPIYYLHRLLTVSAVLFQAKVVNAVKTGDGSAVVPYFKKTMKPVIEGILECAEQF